MSQEANYSVTFVQGKPPMITVRGDNADEWKARLDDAAQSGALAEIRNINDTLNGVRAAAQPAAAKAEPDQQLPESFGVKCKTCGGRTKLISKDKLSPKNGKTYDIYECQDGTLHATTFIEK